MSERHYVLLDDPRLERVKRGRLWLAVPLPEQPPDRYARGGHHPLTGTWVWRYRPGCKRAFTARSPMRVGQVYGAVEPVRAAPKDAGDGVQFRDESWRPIAATAEARAAYAALGNWWATAGAAVGFQRFWLQVTQAEPVHLGQAEDLLTAHDVGRLRLFGGCRDGGQRDADVEVCHADDAWVWLVELQPTRRPSDAETHLADA